MNNNAIEEKENDVKIIETDIDSKDGQNKCPKCGATEISLNINTGKLRCEFCRHEFAEKKIDDLESDISKLEGQVMTSGLQDIQADAKDMLTFKCSSCGAEVVIDTTEALQARCHWCRNVLSVNQQIPNGAVPDVVLPFSIKKEEAEAAKKQVTEAADELLALEKKIEELDKLKEETDALLSKQVAELERISGFTSEQAKEHLLAIIENDVNGDGDYTILTPIVSLISKFITS